MCVIIAQRDWGADEAAFVADLVAILGGFGGTFIRVLVGGVGARSRPHHILVRAVEQS